MGIGDKVEIVNFGCIHWTNTELEPDFKPDNIITTWGEMVWFDICPEMVGQIGIINKISDGGFSLEGVKGKVAWYSKNQLKLIKENVNNK